VFEACLILLSFLIPAPVCIIIVGVRVIVTRIHTHTHTHSVGIFWTSYRIVAGSCTQQHTILTRDRHPCLQRNSNPASELPQNHALDRAVSWIGLSNAKDKLKGIKPLSGNASGPEKGTAKIHVNL